MFWGAFPSLAKPFCCWVRITTRCWRGTMKPWINFWRLRPVFITPKGRSQPSTPKLETRWKRLQQVCPSWALAVKNQKSNKNSTIGFSGSSIQATFRRAVLDGHSGGKFTPEKRLQNERQWFRCPLVQGFCASRSPVLRFRLLKRGKGIWPRNPSSRESVKEKN